jgi:hypothetical protein
MNALSSVSFVNKKWLKSTVIVCCCIMGLSFLPSCKKEIKDPLLLSISPDYLILDLTGGTTLPLTISASGPKNLQRFKIEVQNNNTKTVLLDSTLSWGSRFSLIYNYTLPARSASFQQTLFFTVLDSDGSTAQTSRTLNVAATSTTPLEKTGVKLATKNSGNADAFDLLNQNALMSALDDALLQDVVDAPSTVDVATISHSWKSSNGAKFLAFDGFNYANATKESIEGAFTTGSSVSQINGLAAGSIVIVQTTRGGVKRYYAIQITTVNEDLVGTNDFYLFNMKY